MKLLMTFGNVVFCLNPKIRHEGDFPQIASKPQFLINVFLMIFLSEVRLSKDKKSTAGIESFIIFLF